MSLFYMFKNFNKPNIMKKFSYNVFLNKAAMSAALFVNKNICFHFFFIFWII